MIFAGCPIQNRDNRIEGYLEAFENQTYPLHDIHMCFLVNDSVDKTLEILLDYKKYHKFGKFTIIDLSGFGYTDIYRSRGIYEYNQIAKLRNIWLDRLGDESHIFSVDSDIIIPPDALSRLISHKLDICSLVIHNSYKDREAYNFATFNSTKTAIHRFRKPGINEVDVTGACYLINADVIRSGVRYGPNKRGEDFYFCEMAKKMGFGVYVDMDLEADHLMEGIYE